MFLDSGNFDSDIFSLRGVGEHDIELDSSEGSVGTEEVQQEYEASHGSGQFHGPLRVQPWGIQQGSANSPASYIMARQIIAEELLRQQEEEEVAVESSHSLIRDQRGAAISGGQQTLDFSDDDTSDDAQQTQSVLYEDLDSITTQESGVGDTVASTCSYLSDLEIRSVRSQPTQRRAGCSREIPFREIDDPPDET